MTTVRVIGLDFETSGTEHDKHVPIQIGLATPTGRVFSSLVGGWNWLDKPYVQDVPGNLPANWSIEAQGIHQIDRETLTDAPKASEVDSVSAKFITDNYKGTSPAWVIAVGWNVAAFDFPFLRQHFPKTARNMSYRSIDLNALLFGITEAGLTRPSGMAWGYYDLKKEVKDFAAHRIGEEFGGVPLGIGWHDAGYDAIAALFSYDALRRVLREGILR